MYSEKDLERAVTAGALDEAAAQALRAMAREASGTTDADEEALKLVAGFNDIFVTLACLLVIVALHWIPGGSIAAMAVTWALSELFVRRRRMALPALTLLVSFNWQVFFLVGSTAQHADHVAVLLAAMAVVIASAAYWVRFKVPLAPALALAVLIGAVFFLVTELEASTTAWTFVALGACGACVFALALSLDGRDPARRSTLSDMAFWLHLLAAPMMIHPLFVLLGVVGSPVGWGRLGIVLVTFMAVAWVSLAIDRRALMVSTVGYVIYACSDAISRVSTIEASAPIAALVVGAILLALSARWSACRSFALKTVPKSFRARLPAAKQRALDAPQTRASSGTSAAAG
jgi:hypothetical protein